MQIKYLAHASFLIVSESNLRVITDPYTPGGDLKYAPIDEAADVVTVSHGHGDHSNYKDIKGSPAVLKEPGTRTVKGITFRTVEVFHDEAGGNKRGKDLMFCFKIDGLNLCHTGDLGHSLSAKQIAEIGPLDILFIPVGGYYTIDAAEARAVVRSLNPKLIFPMHYKTPKCSYPISGVEEFLKGLNNARRLDSSQFTVTQQTLPAQSEIIVPKLTY
jgi:L-ascorbate metabolism protein UlaG (beta-lactamase superfamily)